MKNETKEIKGRFKKGNPGKPKGALSEKTKFWNQLKDYMTNDGADKFKDELQKLSGKDYINAFTNTLEYFKPKLQRTELTGEDGNAINITPIELVSQNKNK